MNFISYTQKQKQKQQQQQHFQPQQLQLQSTDYLTATTSLENTQVFMGQVAGLWLEVSNLFDGLCRLPALPDHALLDACHHHYSQLTERHEKWIQSLFDARRLDWALPGDRRPT